MDRLISTPKIIRTDKELLELSDKHLYTRVILEGCLITERQLKHLEYFTNMESLTINGCSIQSIPGRLNVKSFTCIGVGLKRLPELPECIMLNCLQNKLTQLPDLPKCKYLQCSDNRLTCLPDLPACEYLKCSNNKLASWHLGFPLLESEDGNNDWHAEEELRACTEIERRYNREPNKKDFWMPVHDISETSPKKSREDITKGLQEIMESLKYLGSSHRSISVLYSDSDCIIYRK